MRDKSSFVLYGEIEEHLSELSDEDCGKLFRAILQYNNRGEIAELTGEVKMAFKFVRAQMDRDAAKWEESHKRRVASGKKGGLTRGGNAKQEQASLSIANRDLAIQAVNVPVPVPVNVNVPVIEPPLPPVNGGSGDGDEIDDTARRENPRNPHHNSAFDKFWCAYPKKVGKGAALKIWNRIKPDTGLLDQIHKAIEQAKQSDQWQRDNGQFIPHPATWLNQGRWDDELTPMTGGTTNAGFDPDGMAGFHNALDRYDDNGNEIKSSAGSE